MISSRRIRADRRAESAADRGAGKVSACACLARMRSRRELVRLVELSAGFFVSVTESRDDVELGLEVVEAGCAERAAALRSERRCAPLLRVVESEG